MDENIHNHGYGIAPVAPEEQCQWDASQEWDEKRQPKPDVFTCRTEPEVAFAKPTPVL